MDMASWRDRMRRSLVALGPALALGARDRVTVERLPPFESRILGETRTIDVFLPRGYQPGGATGYPVLYANDGQDMEAVDLAGALDSLQRIGAMRPLIVVAVHATQRNQDYGTAGVANTQGLGARAEPYQRFLVEELMPSISGRYRVVDDPRNTGLMGWSLGGLSAFDLGWRRSDRFGIVGAFSGAFWWRTDDGSPMTRQSSRIVHRRVWETHEPPRLRLWFETGMQDETADRDGDGVIDSIQDTEELVTELVLKGYRRGLDVVHLTVEGRHDLPTWRRLLPEFLAWAYPPS